MPVPTSAVGIALSGSNAARTGAAASAAAAEREEKEGLAEGRIKNKDAQKSMGMTGQGKDITLPNDTGEEDERIKTFKKFGMATARGPRAQLRPAGKKKGPALVRFPVIGKGKFALEVEGEEEPLAKGK